VELTRCVDRIANPVKLPQRAMVGCLRSLSTLRQAVYHVLLSSQRVVIALQLLEAWHRPLDGCIANLRAQDIRFLLGLLVLMQNACLVCLAPVPLLLAFQDPHGCSRQTILLAAVELNPVSTIRQLFIDGPEVPLGLLVLG